MLKKLLKNQFARFLLVGGVNTLFGYGIFAFLLFVGLHYAAAAFIGTGLGIVFNFKTTGIIVFNSRDNFLIFKFFAVYGATYLLNVTGLYLFNLAGVSAYIGGAILILPLAFTAFLLNKKFVFKSV